MTIESNEDDKARDEWLEAQKRSTAVKYRSHWEKFAEFTGLTGDEILAQKKAAGKDDFTWEKKVVNFVNWLREKKGLSPNAASSCAQAIRGFFRYHHSDLILNRQEAQKMNDTTRTTEDYPLNLEEIKRMAEVANLKEKYILLAGKSFGLRGGDFLSLTRGHLEPFIDREPPISIGEIITDKEAGVKAYPFIDADARPVIKLMLAKMTQEGRISPEEKMVEYNDEVQVSRVLQRLARRACINTGGRRIRFHLMRKFLCDHLASYMSESKWKQVVGKQIMEAAYVGVDTLRKDWIRAMEDISFTYGKNEDVQKIAKLEALKLFAKASGYTDEDIAKIAQVRLRKRNLTTDDEIEEIERILAEKNKKEEACTDGKNCQRMVSEEDLAKFLGEGWKVVATLPSGRIVIDK